MKPKVYYVVEKRNEKGGWTINRMLASVDDARMEIESFKSLDRIYHREGTRYRIAKLTKEIVKLRNSKNSESAQRRSKLIAASPDLYNAARQAYELLSNMIDGTQSEGLVTDGCAVRETLHKALEKAGGGKEKQKVCRDTKGDHEMEKTIDAVGEHDRGRPFNVGVALTALAAMKLPSARSAIEGTAMKTVHKRTELLRCPNCGSMDSQRDKTDKGNARISCGQCGFTVVRDSPQAAETEWNHLPDRFKTNVETGFAYPKDADGRSLPGLGEHK